MKGKMRPTVLTGFPLYEKTIMSSILGCDGRLLLLSAYARNVRLTKNVDLSAIELATKKLPLHISRMSLVQSGGILFYP
jgi:hypothetical protein